MAMLDDTRLKDAMIPTTGRKLTLPDAPIFKLHRAAQSDYEIGEFRAWAGYKTLGVDDATDGLAHLQHVVSFAGTEAAGRTGIHAHLAQGHIVIPTSGRGLFSYDGVITEAAPGMVIVQHGGTVHDQFDYSFAAASEAENRRTPQSVDPQPPGAPLRSFGFLELFIPKTFANVEVVPPGAVTAADQRTAWRHPYHAEGARFFLQGPDDAGAAYRPMAGRGDLEARDAGTWSPTGELVATWIVRPASGGTGEAPVSLDIPREKGGLDILHMLAGSAAFARCDGEIVRLSTGDTLTSSQGVLSDPFDVSPDMRLIRFFIAERAQALRERTADEIARLEALGAGIITGREARPEGDARPVNVLQGL
jgi:mannose-6-phosphate isomerase-like protein (cupin superfamily)